MKPDSRKSTEVSSGATTDLAAQYAALKQQEFALAEQKAQVRKAIWDDSVTKLRSIVQNLTADGYDPAQIGKALGFHARSAPAGESSRKGTGPSTNAGWFQIFRSRALQVYLKSHPDLAQSLKDRHIRSSEYSAHVPPEDLQKIDAAAQSKANAKCPVAPVA